MTNLVEMSGIDSYVTAMSEKERGGGQEGWD